MAMELVFGALTTECLVAALFFARFYRSSGDRFFLFFAGAFVAFALDWAGHGRAEAELHSYGLRLVGFVLIAFAALDKSARVRGSDRPGDGRS